MNDVTSAPAGLEPAPVVTPGNLDLGGEFSAADALASYRKKTADNSPAESAPAATAETELVDETNAAPAEEQALGEATEEAEPADQPPIEPPRSWTKAEKERFQSLPRETQEYLHTREQEREREVRRSQNEAAEARKVMDAERSQLEQQRKEYEAKLPALMESLQRQSEFADIRNLDDVKKLQAEDPFRFQQWQIYQMDAQAIEHERRNAEERQAKEQQDGRSKYTRDQEIKLHELVPEMKDPAKASEMRTKAVSMLVDDYGFSEGELGAYMQSDGGFKLLNDARMQKLIADGLKFAELRRAPPKAIPKTVPAVQKPGAARAPGAASADAIQASRNKLNSTGSVEDAFALYQAKRARA